MPDRQLKHRLQLAGHFPIAIDWNEVNTVECLRFSKQGDEFTCNRNPGISIGIESADDAFRYSQLRHLG